MQGKSVDVFWTRKVSYYMCTRITTYVCAKRSMHLIIEGSMDQTSMGVGGAVQSTYMYIDLCAF